MIQETFRQLAELTYKHGESKYIELILMLITASTEIMNICVTEGVTGEEQPEDKKPYLEAIENSKESLNYVCEQFNFEPLPDTDPEVLAFEIINSFRPK